jgi:hypothetical protein
MGQQGLAVAALLVTPFCYATAAAAAAAAAEINSSVRLQMLQ